MVTPPGIRNYRGDALMIDSACLCTAFGVSFRSHRRYRVPQPGMFIRRHIVLSLALVGVLCARAGTGLHSLHLTKTGTI
jgi:hypothetical protein